MKKISLCVALTGICSVFLCSAYANPAAADSSNIKYKAHLKGQYTYNENNDLDTLDAKSQRSENIEFKASVYGDINEDFSFLTEARAVKNYGDGGSIDSDTGEAAGRDDFVELRQYWLEYSGLSQFVPLSLRAGRQRIRESRSLWWNRDLDAVSLIYDATLFSGFLSVGENLTEYRSSSDVFNRDDENLLRVLGQTSWQWKQNNFLEARFAFQDDHSGIESVGAQVPSDDEDDEDSDLFWFGARATGEIEFPQSKPIETISYRADIIGLTGSQDNELSTANGNGKSTVTGSSEEDVSAWAIDAGLDITLPVGNKPVITLGYAFGSGDDDSTDGDNNEFRQTGLDGNTSKMLGSNSSYYNYGSVLRPDLANIHIITAGVGMPIMKNSHVGFKYHYYMLDEDATSLATSGLTASLNGTDKDLGHGVDLAVNVDVSEELNITHKGFDRIDLKTTLGAFHSGDAYGTAEGETALRGQIDLRFRF